MSLLALLERRPPRLRHAEQQASTTRMTRWCKYERVVLAHHGQGWDRWDHGRAAPGTEAAHEQGYSQTAARAPGDRRGVRRSRRWRVECPDRSGAAPVSAATRLTRLRHGG